MPILRGAIRISATSILGSVEARASITIQCLSKTSKKSMWGGVAADDCMLFLWVTFPNLQEGLDVIKAWGFKYKTLGFSWIKTNKKNGKPFFGIGYYTKSNCEVCLIGVKGKPIKVSNSISSVVIEPRAEHSKKPDSVREKIVALCGDIPRLEMFARTKTAGWDIWGNEIKNDIVIENS